MVKYLTSAELAKAILSLEAKIHQTYEPKFDKVFQKIDDKMNRSEVIKRSASPDVAPELKAKKKAVVFEEEL